MHQVQLPLPVIKAASTSSQLNQDIQAFFNKELSELSKPARDLRFIHLQTAIHTLKHKSGTEESYKTLLNHLRLVQSQCEEAYLEKALAQERANKASLLETLAPK